MSIRWMVLLGFLFGLAGGAQARELTVVQVADLSASRAVLGQAVNAGAKVWFDHVNAQGGINGNRIHFVAHDDQYRVDETLRLVKEALAKE